MALLITRPIADGFPEHTFYVRVHCAAAVKTRLAERPDPNAIADAAFAAKVVAGLTLEDIARRPAMFDGQPTRWTSDDERLKDAAGVEADRARRFAEESARTASERDVRSSARIEFYRSKAEAEAGRMPFDVTFAPFDLDISDGAPNALAQAYEAAKRRYPNAVDDGPAVTPVSVPEPVPTPPAAPSEDAHNFPENLADTLSDRDTVPDEASLTTADLTEEVIQRLTAAKRKKFTELLNVELAELQQERGGPREDLVREAEIEKLLGLFARVGEM